MDVSVIVATYGDKRWRGLAHDRALPSAKRQTVEPREVITAHGETLHEARNHGASFAKGHFLCFLDADDELDQRYIEAMAGVAGDGPELRLFAPAVRFGDAAPVVLADRNIDRLNPCVVGTLVRRSLFDAVGGFWDWPAWEDWCLFRRCWLAGAEIVHVPDAVYRAHLSPEGRNSRVAGDKVLHRRIRKAHEQWARQRVA